MVSKRALGGMMLGASVGFGGILWLTIRNLMAKSSQMGCILGTPQCVPVTTGLGLSHLAIGFVTAVFSLGAYFLLFHKDRTEILLEEQQRRHSREEQVELLSKVMTPGERALLSAISKEDGILQATLRYRTNLTPGRISQVLDDFESQGLVKRTPEGKSYRVFLSI